MRAAGGLTSGPDGSRVTVFNPGSLSHHSPGTWGKDDERRLAVRSIRITDPFGFLVVRSPDLFSSALFNLPLC